MSAPYATTPVFPTNATAVTPSDSTEFAPSAIYVGVGGNVTVRTLEGNTVEFVGVPAGACVPVLATQVRAATTAGSLVRVF